MRKEETMKGLTVGELLLIEQLVKQLPVGSRSSKYNPNACTNSKAKERRLKQAKKQEKPNDGE
jgi:hypothetical protein